MAKPFSTKLLSILAKYVMKVLLINPSVKKGGTGWLFKWGIHPPLGLCNIAAVIEKHGYKVKIIDNDVERLSDDELKKELELFKPDVVGLTGESVKYKAIIDHVNIIKEVSNAKVVLGGVHASILPLKTMNEVGKIDFLVIGEGEYTLLELLQALESDCDFKKIKGLVWRKGGEIIINPKRELISNLDELPLPARHLLPDLKMYKQEFGYKRLPVTSVITSRGCPFNCTFCSKVFGNTYRHHSAEYTINEIKHLIEKYKIKEIDFLDDTFLLDIKYVEKLCEMIKSEKLDITWRCNGRINVLINHLDILPKIKKAGCWYISFGIESGNKEVLASVKKEITLEQTREVIKHTHKAGIFSKGHFMIGFPNDTKDTINDTINFAKSIHLDSVAFYLVYPLYGTELYSQALKSGTFNKGDFENMFGEAGDDTPYVPEGLTKEYLVSVQKEAYRKFYLNPRYILRQVRYIRDLPTAKRYVTIGWKYATKLLSN